MKAGYVMSLDKLQSAPPEILNTFLVNLCSFQAGKSSKHTRAYNASEKSSPMQTLILNQSISKHGLDDILSHIPADLPYFEWVAIGMALHSEGYPLSIWEEWSKKGSSYKPNECARKWQGFTCNKGVSLGTLIFIAKQYGYRGRFQNLAKTFKQRDIIMNISEFDGQFAPVIPFDGYDTPDIPCDLMPESISSHLKDISHILQVPEALCVLNALGILSACLNGKYKVQVKPDWLEPVNIYVMALLPPASRKSPVFNLLLSEINE